jgi:hypothetical protein
MVDRIPVLLAEMARIVIPIQNEAAELLVREQPPNRIPIDDNRGAFPHKSDRELRIDLLIPATAVVGLSAHADKAHSRRLQARSVERACLIRGRHGRFYLFNRFNRFLRFSRYPIMGLNLNPGRIDGSREKLRSLIPLTPSSAPLRFGLCRRCVRIQAIWFLRMIKDCRFRILSLNSHIPSISHPCVRDGLPFHRTIYPIRSFKLVHRRSRDWLPSCKLEHSRHA